jgi:hypothetical protein
MFAEGAYSLGINAAPFCGQRKREKENGKPGV